jgi:hypothetical protein
VESPDILDPQRLVERNAEQIAPPNTRILLFLNDLPDAGVAVDFGPEGLELRGVEYAREDVGRQPVPDRGTGVGKQPRQGDVMGSGEFQGRASCVPVARMRS